MSRMPTLAEVIRRSTALDEEGHPQCYQVSLVAALTAGDDDRHILSYLRGMGLVVRALDDLQLAIESIEGEEELSAEWVLEGLVVHHASDGWMTLFVR